MALKPHLLYISYYFPPIHSVASLRNYHLAHHMSEHCQEVRILTTANQKFFPQAPKDLSKLRVYTLPTCDYRTLRAWFHRDKSVLHFDEYSKKNILLKFLIKLNETWPVSFLMGEGGAVFILSALWQWRYFFLSSEDQKIVITPFRPAANVIAGYLGKCLFPKSLWIISMHDIPFNHRRPNSYLPDLQKALWRCLFKKADLVTTLSEGLATEFQKYGVNTPVIRNGIVPRTPVSEDEEIFTMTFTGSLYDTLISPEVFMAVIEDLLFNKKLPEDKIRIRYAGKDSATWLRYADKFPVIRKICRVYSLLPHDKALDWQTRSHINLLLTWNDSHVKGILTGKLFEYLGAGNPVLAIVNGTRDIELENLFSHLSCGTVVYTSSEQIKDQIQNFILDKYHLWQSGRYSESYIPRDTLIPYSWETQSELFWQLISRKI